MTGGPAGTGGVARRGPRPLEEEAVAEFLGASRAGALCVEDSSGELRAVPVQLSGMEGGRLRLLLADPSFAAGAARLGMPASVVADEFASYEKIKGTIVQGTLRPGPSDVPGSLVLEVGTAIGFSFAGTLPPQLAGQPLWAGPGE